MSVRASTRLYTTSPTTPAATPTAPSPTARAAIRLLKRTPQGAGPGSARPESESGRPAAAPLIPQAPTSAHPGLGLQKVPKPKGSPSGQLQSCPCGAGRRPLVRSAGRAPGCPLAITTRSELHTVQPLGTQGPSMRRGPRRTVQYGTNETLASSAVDLGLGGGCPWPRGRWAHAQPASSFLATSVCLAFFYPSLFVRWDLACGERRRGMQTINSSSQTRRRRRGRW